MGGQPQDRWHALVLLRLSKAFVCLTFTQSLLLRRPERGSHFFLLVCKKHGRALFIIVEFFSAKLKTYIEMDFSQGTEFRYFTTYK